MIVSEIPYNERFDSTIDKKTRIPKSFIPSGYPYLYIKRRGLTPLLVGFPTDGD